jgi:hypothetical protein
MALIGSSRKNDGWHGTEHWHFWAVGRLGAEIAIRLIGSSL